jgi:gliding motility-associated-like protein
MIFKKLLIFFSSLMILTPANSNHLFGGEIQYKIVDSFNGIYEIQLILNRSCKDYALPITQFVEVKNCMGQTISIPLDLFKKEIISTPCFQGTCEGNQNINIEVNYYKTNILIGKNCGLTRVQYSGQNRAYSNTITNLETPLYLCATINTDFNNSSAQINFLSNSNPNLSEKYIQSYRISDSEADSVFIDISAPFVSEGSTNLNEQVATLNPTLNNQRPLYITESQIVRGKNFFSFTPSISQNAWINYIVYEFKKISRINKLDTFVLISKRNVDKFYSISSLSSGISLHSVSSNQSAMHIDSNKIIYCNDFQSPQVTFSYLIPKNRANESIKLLDFDNNILSESKTFQSGSGILDTIQYQIYFKPSIEDKDIDFQIEVSVCESNISKSKLFSYTMNWFQHKIFEKDTFLNCGTNTEVQIPLLSNKNIVFNYKKQSILKLDTSLNMKFNNPIDTFIYAQYVVSNPYCPLKDSIYLNQGDLIEDSIKKSNATCFGYENGTAKVIITKGNGPFQYHWMSLNHYTDSIGNLKKGNYTLQILDNDGCSKEEKFSILEPNGVQYTWVQDLPILCKGDASAKGHFKLNTAVKPFQYTWNHSTSTDSFLNSIKAGNYSGAFSYINSLNNTCTQPFQITISEPDSVTFDYIKFDNLCFGESKGKIAINPKGGVGFYLYYIDDIPSIHSLKDELSNQSYSVKVRDFNNCFSATKSITISSLPPIKTKYQINKPSCTNSNNGSIAIGETVGGYGFYEYKLDSNPYSNSATFNAIPSKDSILISLRDAYGCKVDTTVAFSGAYQLNVSKLKPDSLTCFDSKNGMALLEFSNGEIPYKVNLNRSQFSFFAKKNIITNLQRGAYTISIEDKNGCQWDSVFQVVSSSAFQVKDSAIKPTCFGYTDAKLYVKISGGSPPYSNYSWNNSPPQTTKDIQNIKSGSYIFSFIDSKRCVYIDTLFVPDAEVFRVEIAELVKPICSYSNDGVLASNVFGGNAPFTYIWNQNTLLNQSILNKVSSGSLNVVKVIDSKGCEQTKQFQVAKPMGYDFSKIKTKSPTCPELKNGFIEFIKNPLDTILWQYSIEKGGQYLNTTVFNNLGKDTYSISVKNQVNCIYDTLLELLPEKSIEIAMPLVLDSLNPGQEWVLNPSFNYFNTQFSDIKKMTWSPATFLSCGDCQIPTAKPYKTTNYKFNISYGNECNSEGTTILNVRKIQDIYIPNIFTPNQDEKNDCWRVFGTNIDKISVQIFDRIGQKVYSSNMIDFCWDGSYKGQLCKNDIYLYKIEVGYKDGNLQEYKGQLMLLK